MKLHDLQPAEGSHKPRTRVGRGIAAGKGKTAGRGTKGQKARAGGSHPALVRGRPDAAPHAHPEAARLQEPVQDRVRGRERRGHRRARRARRVRDRRDAGKRRSRPRPGRSRSTRTSCGPSGSFGRSTSRSRSSAPATCRCRCSSSPTRSPRRLARRSRPPVAVVNVLEVPTTAMPALGVDGGEEPEAPTAARSDSTGEATTAEAAADTAGAPADATPARSGRRAPKRTASRPPRTPMTRRDRRRPKRPTHRPATPDPCSNRSSMRFARPTSGAGSSMFSGC